MKILERPRIIQIAKRSVPAVICLTLVLLSSICAAAVQTTTSERPPTKLVAKSNDVVKSQGTIEAVRKVVYRNRTRDSLAIIFLVENGSRVRAGDVILRFDSSGIEQKLAIAKIDAAQIKSEVLKAEAKLQTLRLDSKTTLGILQADLKLLEAESSFLFSKDGKFATEIAALDDSIKFATQRIATLERRILEAPKREINRLDLAEWILQKSEIFSKLETAKRNRKYLSSVARPFEEKRIDNKKEKLKLLYDKSAREHELAIKEAQANLATVKLHMALEVEKKDEITKDLSQCQLVADKDGVIFHSNIPSIDFVVEEGAMVRARQNVLYMPDFSAFKAVVTIPENQVSSIEVGQPALIRGESGGKEFSGPGVVTKVGTFPVRGWNSKSGEVIKAYEVEIQLKAPGEFKLSTSITAEIKIK